MKMLLPRAVAQFVVSRTILMGACVFAFGFILAHSAFPQSPPNAQPKLLITPSSATFMVGSTSPLSATDESGKPIANVTWSINPQIATLREEDGAIFVEGTQVGQAVLTATANNQTATATISVLEKLPPATVLWSLLPMPGFQTLKVVQATPGTGPAFYSVEWSKSENAIVRALDQSGRQQWVTRLSSTASPSTLKHTLPDAGEVFQNGTLVSDHSMFLIGEQGQGFASSHSNDPRKLGLPEEGHSILLAASGDAVNGMLLLERGTLNDSLVDLNPTDGSESWHYQSKGRLAKDWTVNSHMDIGIVETLAKPISSALLVLSGETGAVRFRIPLPVSSSTVDGFRCTDPQRNILKSVRPSVAGAVFSSVDGTMYLQVETHVESVLLEACKNKRYSFDDSLALLNVTADGESNWKTFQQIHAEGDGGLIAQPRVFAGETIPDGFGGVLAAWTYLPPDARNHELRSEARVSRIGPEGQRDFTLPMPFWTKGLNSLFDENMVLGEGNFLYATNGPQVLRLDTKSGEVNWVRRAPSGEIKLDHSTAGGGLLVSNAGRFVYLDTEGKAAFLPWTVQVSNPEDVGLVQTDPFENKPLDPLQLRDASLCWAGDFIAVEDSSPYGHGALLYFTAQ